MQVVKSTKKLAVTIEGERSNRTVLPRKMDAVAKCYFALERSWLSQAMLSFESAHGRGL
jgi:hypothetical protein